MKRSARKASDSTANYWTRRDFLGIAGTATGALLFLDPTSAAEVGAELPTHRFRVRRDEDLAVLEFSFVNFAVRKGKLCALGKGRSLVIVRFPPQNLAEALFDRPPSGGGFEIQPIGLNGVPPGCPQNTTPNAGSANNPKPPVRSYLSGPSWVVFSVPDGTKLPFTKASLSEPGMCCEAAGADTRSPSVVDAWLQCMANWKIRVPANAVTPGSCTTPSVPVMPRADETRLEIPFRLFIAPTKENTRMLTSSEPQWILGDVAPERPRELWHAAILCREQLTPATLPDGINISSAPELAPPSYVTTQARAVYTPDYDPNGAEGTNLYYPGNMMLSLMTSTRRNLVKQMAEGNGWIDAEHLVLSALGCDASFSYISQTSFKQLIAAQLAAANQSPNSPPPGCVAELSIWKHRIVVGRDVYFIEASPGFLLPHTFPCFFVELTKRRFAAYSSDSTSSANFSAPGAYLLKEYYIVCVDPIKNFAGADNAVARGMPLKRAIVTETRSPLLLDPVVWFPIKDDVDQKKVAALSAAEQGIVQPAINGPAHPPDNLYFIPRPLQNPCPSDGRSDGVRWNVSLTDAVGQQVQAPSCFMFASNIVVGQLLWNCLRDDYRRAAVPAQKVSYAPEKPVLVVPSKVRDDATPKGVGPHELQDAERLAAAKLGTALRQWSDIRTKILTALKDQPTPIACAQKCAADLLSLIKTDGSPLVAALLKDLQDQTKKLKQQASAVYQQLLSTITDANDGLKDANVVAVQLETQTWTQLKAIANVIDNSSQELKAAAVTDLVQQLARAQQVSSSLETHGLTFDCGRLAAEKVTGAGRLSDASTKIQRILNAAKSVDDFMPQIQGYGPTSSLPDDQAIKLLEDSYWYQRVQGQLQALVDTAKTNNSDAQKQLQVLQRTATTYLTELKNAEDDLRQVGNQWFHSQLASADVMIPAIKAMMPDAPVCTISHLDDYLAKGINLVENGVFAKLDQAIDPRGALADKVRTGLAQPAMKVAGLSRDLGALTSEGEDTLKSLARQSTGIDLSQAIPDARMFGVLSLKDIIGAAKAEAGQQLNSLLDSANLPTINLADVPDKYVHTWQWSVPVHDLDLGLVKFIPDDTGTPFPVLLHMLLTTEIDRPNSVQQILKNQNQVDTGKIESLAKVTLDGFLGFWDEQGKQGYTDETDPDKYAFKLNLLGLVEAQFGYLKINAQGSPGQSLKPTLKPKINKVGFLGPLQFVNDLEDFLESLLGGGFDLELTPTGLLVGFDMGPIDIGVGVVSLEDVSIGASMTLPFGSDPLTFSFNFCTFDDPFTLSVMCFAGAGYFECSFESGGNRSLQAALEFGGALSFNVVVAKGDLYVMAGIYFSLDNNSATVAAFFRAGGHLQVLALINATVEFLLMLAYRNGKGVNELYGIASLVVSIDLFMFSIDVTVTMEKTFAGSGSKGGAPNDNSGSNILRKHQPRMLFASQTTSTANPTTPQPMAFFKPRQALPFTNGAAEAYRFENEAQWNKQYWSQFAF